MTQEQENKRFDGLRRTYGDLALEEKIQKLDSCRKYNRRWPYDNNQKRAGMDTVDLVHPSDPLGEIIAEESRGELLSGLTDRELWVAARAEEGYKPREMAEMRGKVTSNADRWIKHSVKTKMEAMLAGDQP